MNAPNITHHPSGVSYCNDCGFKLVLMDDDVHDCIEAHLDNPTELHTFIVGDEGHLKCPGSYAYDGDEAAWYALAGYYIFLEANGPTDDADLIESLMSQAVNDSADLLELIANNWADVPAEVQEQLAVDLSGFVAEHFDALVAPDELSEMVDGYLTAGLWASTMPDDSGEDGLPMDDYYTIDQCVNRWDAENDCRSFVCLTWSTLTWWRTSGYGEWSQIGHDFLLTRDHHGAGFWDRGIDYQTQSAGRVLTTAAQTFGDSEFMPEWTNDAMDPDWFCVAST